MWSLPDINRMNACAAASAAKLRREAKSKNKQECRRCAIFGRDRKADVSFLVYDIFSDDPKSVLHLCENCVGQSGDPWEGYFTCEGCGRVMVENYTWERYQTVLDGASLCLKCAAERFFADTDNWIEPKLVKRVVLVPYDPALNGQNLPLFDPATGVLNVARCRHVLGVRQPLPKGIKFLDNAEFDSFDGHQISGLRLLDLIAELDEPFCPVLDAAYQFAVSIGLYTRQPKRRVKRNSHILRREAA
jgi:hypothetical protein